MSEISFNNTVIGMHLKAKELKTEPYYLGCSCYECNKAFDKMLEKLDENQSTSSTSATR